ncbi:Hypothetical protein KVN_LOCUS17 [uncultured virus]|nr:Hypothetical protein KVN_LOCUS17 [uncultured virus]
MIRGLLRLVALGAQDIYLNQQKEIKFFNLEYKRHKNFFIDPVPNFDFMKQSLFALCSQNINFASEPNKKFINFSIDPIPVFDDLTFVKNENPIYNDINDMIIII